MVGKRRHALAVPAHRLEDQGKVEIMQIPSGTKPALWGAVAGAIATLAVGFSWGGWTTARTAETLANERAVNAVVAALAPICADNFRRATDSPGQLADLKKLGHWDQAAFVEKGGWAKMPGIASIEPGMAAACADMILMPKT
jgi:pimeloyl-ACP methyl ester carboxylesterase